MKTEPDLRVEKDCIYTTKKMWKKPAIRKTAARIISKRASQRVIAEIERCMKRTEFNIGDSFTVTYTMHIKDSDNGDNDE